MVYFLFYFAVQGGNSFFALSRYLVKINIDAQCAPLEAVTAALSAVKNFASAAPNVKNHAIFCVDCLQRLLIATYTHKHTHAHTHTHTHIYTRTHTHIYTHTHAHTHIPTYTHTYTHTHIYTHTHTRVYVFVYVYV